MLKAHRMNMLMVLIGLILLGGGILAKPAFAQNCVDRLIASITHPTRRPITLVIHNQDNTWVSFSQGYLTPEGNHGWAVYTHEAMSQLFSDRLWFPQNFTQPFAAIQADLHSVRIQRGDPTYGESYLVKIWNCTWGFENRFRPICLTDTVLYGWDAYWLYIISVGPVENR
jgi:hypothetical protein